MDALQPGRVIAGRYRLERQLAQGGMGCVWTGRHLQLDVPIAVKLMTRELAHSSEARTRFEREAKASAQLRSIHTVQIFDFGVDGELPYIVMELLEGEDLEARLQRRKRLSPAETWSLLEPICRGLRAAHEAGLVHRDLKPANVFLARQAGQEVVKLLDFGIAKVAAQPPNSPGATKTGALLGSPHYMSPEQIRSTAKADWRSDLWAAGVIAFRCLTGQLPFPGEEIGEVLIDVVTQPVPIASQVAPDLGPAADRFFERALSKDLGRRFQSAAELAEAFAAYVNSAHPAGAGAAPAQAAPVLPAVQVPAASFAHVPAASFAQMPGASIAQVPGASLAQMPGASFAQMPGASIAHVPAATPVHAHAAGLSVAAAAPPSLAIGAAPASAAPGATVLGAPAIPAAGPAIGTLSATANTQFDAASRPASRLSAGAAMAFIAGALLVGAALVAFFLLRGPAGGAPELHGAALPPTSVPAAPTAEAPAPTVRAAETAATAAAPSASAPASARSPAAGHGRPATTSKPDDLLNHL